MVIRQPKIKIGIFFGAISGSSVADTASVGSVLIPAMERRGYSREFANGVTISGSVQALLTPPSHNSVLCSLAAGGTVPIASLFMAGVVPGLLMSACLMVLCLIFAKKRDYPKGEVIPLKQALKICADALWGLMAMVIILGGILSGNRYVILRCINAMLLLLGTVVDMAPLILILTPIVLPVVLGIGVDPVHFGMIMRVNLGIGLITPPVGAVLFVGAAVGKVSIEKTVKPLLRHTDEQATHTGLPGKLGCYPLVPWSNRIAHGGFDKPDA